LLKTAPVLCCLTILAPMDALAFDLSGAWASQEDLCSRVFTKKGDAVEFTELSELFGSGFVIDGKQVRGRAARCTINSRKQDGDSIELAASCATTIMTQDAKFNLKVLDDNTIERSFADIPGMTLRYSRCKL
jgi:hypothetical protein